jgi:adenylate cyclase
LQREQTQRSYAYAGIGVFVIISIGAGVAYSRKRKDNRIIASEKKRSDDLLLNILPAEVAEELKANGEAGARYYDHVSILFTDFVGFTKLSEKFSPEELIAELNYCFKAFDEIITRHNIEKIKTIGDSYMAVSGLPAGNHDHAVNAVNAALEMRNFIENYKTERRQQGRVYFEMRTGINSGQVVAGIVGIKKFAYDVWGDAVNIASRMESNGVAGKVNISESTYTLIKDNYATEFRGELDAKGKGLIKMYFVEPKSK